MKEALSSVPNATCPKCRSSNVCVDRRPTKVAMLLAFFGLPVKPPRDRYFCSSCAAHWKRAQ